MRQAWSSAHTLQPRLAHVRPTPRATLRLTDGIGVASKRDLGPLAVLVRRLRVAAGLSQEALAERAGISPRGLSDLERGLSRTARLQTLTRLADALDIPADARAELLRTGQSIADARSDGSLPPPPALEQKQRISALPRTLTSFVGRIAELAEARRLLAEVPLLTLLGPGGIGKTRLCLTLCESVRSDFSDGVVFVDLAQLDNSALLVPTLASAIGLPDSADGDLRRAIIESLRPKHVLLVIDNCEHLVHACAQLIEMLLLACPRLRIVATSREPIGVPGETFWRVPGLGVPDVEHLPTLESLREIESIVLFVERARSVQPDFALDEQNAMTVAELCVRLGGMPLSIELAAARIRVLSPAELAERLESPLQVLGGAARTAPARQQTLRATLEWSFDLLSDPERCLLSRVSVFAGGCTLAAVESVCGSDGIERTDVLDLMTQLVDKSLLFADHETKPTRYGLLAPVRQFAGEQLDETGKTAVFRDRQRDWCMDLVTKAASEWFGPHQVDWLERLEQEHDNLRAALTWCATQPERAETGLSFAAGLWRFWDVRGYLSEGREYLRALLALVPTEPIRTARTQAIGAAGYLAIVCGAHAEARLLLEEASAAWKVLEDKQGLAQSALHLGLLSAWSEADGTAAEAYLTRSLEVSRDSGPGWIEYFSLMRLGDLARLRGDLVRAEALVAESLALTRAADDAWARARCLHSLGLVKLSAGELDAADDLCAQSLVLAAQLQDRRGMVFALEALAGSAAAKGRADWAAQLFGRAESLGATMGDVRSALFGQDRERGIAAAREQLGELAFQDAYLRGRSLSLDAIAEIA